jgi:hypothetical protein
VTKRYDFTALTKPPGKKHSLEIFFYIKVENHHREVQADEALWTALTEDNTQSIPHLRNDGKPVLT